MKRDEFLRVRGQFEELAEQLTSAFLQESKPVRARLPRGFIRALSDLTPRWPFLDTKRRHTVACMLQLCDVIRWNLNMWNIGLTAGTMWEWHCTLPVVAVIEALLREYGLQTGLISQKDKLKTIIDKLTDGNVLSQQLREDLHPLREYRNRIHLHVFDKVELCDGKPRRYNEAVRALQRVEDALVVHAQLEGTPA